MEPAYRSPYVASVTLSSGGRDSPVIFAPNSESEKWLEEWQSMEAKELIDGSIVTVDANASVEDACDALLSSDASCVAIKDPSYPSSPSPFLGLLDYADVNAFLALAATQHALSPDDLRGNPRAEEIVKAAKAGKVPVHLVSNLSEKDPLEILSGTSTLVDMLSVFATGTHRILIRSDAPNPSESESEFIGFVSDRALLSFFHAHAQKSAPLNRFLSNSLHSLTLPSLNLRTAVLSCAASAPVNEAMALMSVQGVSSIAVVEDSPTSMQMTLLSAVSVTDIGKIVVPSQSNQILQMTLQQFVAQIKEPDGSTDGEDRYPVYSVSAGATLRFTIEKILATNAHRVFINEDSHSGGSSPVSASPPTPPGLAGSAQLRGVVSVVDILALFARLAGLSDVDPSRMQRHRRASSANSSTPLTAPRSPEMQPTR